MKPIYVALAALACIAPLGSELAAQGDPAGRPDMPLDARTREQVIEGVLARIADGYVLPEKARAMDSDVRARARRGEYDTLTIAAAFADALTGHLRHVSRDRHLGVQFSPAPLPTAPAGEPGPEMRQRMQTQLRFMNFGFEKVEHLPGNVGYVELIGFAPTMEGAGEVVAAAMNFVARTDALIIDLRRNSGGEPAMVRLLASYLFGDAPVHLNSLHRRRDGRVDEYWTLSEVAGARYGTDRPIYVLTSAQSFSAAEELAYDLQSRGRAKVVGEATGGGAHEGAMERVTDHFALWLPMARAVNPVTGTNWEGSGVRPDLPVAADRALGAAHAEALRTLLGGSTDPQYRGSLERILGQIATE